VAAVVLDPIGRIVLVRHRRGDSVYHLLPGGGVEARETLEEALVREVREETGFEVALGEPLFINDTIDPAAGGRHIVNITFRARITGGAVTDHPIDDRIEAVEIIDPSQLAGLDLRPPLSAEVIDVIAQGFVGPARYLGPLWAPETGGTPVRDAGMAE
jgi:ADP-ribose pyrophosphatase YjhB (NUDIX family)